MVSSSAAASLDNHREPHPAGCTNCHQSELSISAGKLIQKSHCDPRSGCAEWMSDRNRSAHHIESCEINFADGLRKTCAFSPVRRFESAKIGKNLRSKRFVHLDEIDVLEREARALQGDGCR